MTSAVFVDKLHKSFDKLEHCISVTEDVLQRRSEVPAEVLCRIKQYNEIVTKQRNLANELKSHLDSQNWAEVTRHVKLINGLSALIREDAQELLSDGGELFGELAEAFMAQ